MKNIIVLYNDDDIVYFDMTMEVTMKQRADVNDVTAVLDDAFSSSCQVVFTDAAFYRIPHVVFDFTTILPTTLQENNEFNTPKVKDIHTTTLTVSQTQSVFDAITTTTTIKHSNKCNRK